jgi:IS1 family transposase/transposase-like protein
MTITWMIRALLGIALIWCGIVYVVLYVRGEVGKAKRRATKQPKYRPKWYKKSKSFEGLTHQPVCALCEAGVHAHPGAIAEGGAQRERPPQIKAKRGPKRKVDTRSQYCPHPLCPYYGWLNCGNIRSNGHPNGGPHRQLECVACKTFFMETEGTMFKGSRVPAKTILWAISALCEGVGIRKVARICGVEPDVVLSWLVEASKHSEAVSRYMLHDLHLSRVQMDELYALLGGMKVVEDEGEEEDKEGVQRSRLHSWLWSGIDPESKLLLAVEVGDRTLDMAQRLVHWIAETLAPGVIPLFETDQLASYEKAILGHWGEWIEPDKVDRTDGQNEKEHSEKPRWMPQARPQYAQVVKERSRKRIVGVTHRIVYGTKEAVSQVLARVGQKINTAFIERLNRTFRAHIPGLNRREENLSKTNEGLKYRAFLFWGYYNFCLPHISLRERLLQPIPTKGTGSPKKWKQRTPAMTAGLTDHIWEVQEMLLFRVPPWRQQSQVPTGVAA